jgi:response regulator RpfG family c-di-GMP phosphodiesterase
VSDDTDAPPPAPISQSRALRAKSDALVEKGAALQARSLELRQRIRRLDWSEVKVLNVEDHDGARFLRTRTLEKAGYTVVEATTAGEAIALGTSEASLKVALLDVGLPDGDGFRVCEQLKTHRPAIRVVMITSMYRRPRPATTGSLPGPMSTCSIPSPVIALCAPSIAC